MLANDFPELDVGLESRLDDSVAPSCLALFGHSTVFEAKREELTTEFLSDGFQANLPQSLERILPKDQRCLRGKNGVEVESRNQPLVDMEKEGRRSPKRFLFGRGRWDFSRSFPERGSHSIVNGVKARPAKRGRSPRLSERLSLGMPLRPEAIEIEVQLGAAGHAAVGKRSSVGILDHLLSTELDGRRTSLLRRRDDLDRADFKERLDSAFRGERDRDSVDVENLDRVVEPPIAPMVSIPVAKLRATRFAAGGSPGPGRDSGPFAISLLIGLVVAEEAFQAEILLGVRPSVRERKDVAQSELEERKSDITFCAASEEGLAGPRTARFKSPVANRELVFDAARDRSGKAFTLASAHAIFPPNIEPTGRNCKRFPCQDATHGTRPCGNSGNSSWRAIFSAKAFLMSARPSEIPLKKRGEDHFSPPGRNHRTEDDFFSLQGDLGAGNRPRDSISI